MCGGRHEHRGFGRRGFPSRDVWVERLRAYQDDLERELRNVRDVIERLGGDESPEQPNPVV